jgi:hypothetical protein
METDMTRRMSSSLSTVILSVLVWSGCAVGPNYKRPTVDVPVTYREAATETPASSTAQTVTQPAPPQSAASLGDEKWWNVFQDEELRNLIRIALKNNYDVRIAATRVLEAQAQLGITRADQYPSLGVGASVADQRSPSIGPRRRRGTWISGDVIGAPRNLRERICSLMSGHESKLWPLWLRMLQRPIFNFGNSISSSKFPSERLVREANR